MPYGTLQHISLYCMIYRKLHADFVNGHISHNAGSGNIQGLQIAGNPIRKIKCAFGSGQGFVIRPGTVEDLFIVSIRQLGCCGIIGLDYLGLVNSVDMITDCGI